MTIFKHKQIFFLILILVSAGILRLWNFNFDADTSKPFSYDFLAKIKQIKNVALEKEFRPESFRQPYFLIYSGALILKGFDVVGLYKSEILRQTLVIYMILFSLLTVFIAFLIGRIVFNARIGLLSALILGVAPINVIGSRYFKEDMPLLFFINLAVLFMVLLLKTGKKHYYFWVAASIGVAVAVKYSGLIILPIFFVSHLMFIKNNFSIKSFFSKEAIISLFIILAVFLAINPYVVLSWDEFKSGFLYQIKYSQEGHNDETAILWSDYFGGFYLLYAIIPGISFLITLAFFGGVYRAVFRKKIILAILLIIWIILWYAVFEYSKAKPFPFFSRYLHPIFPAISVFAAYFLYGIYEFSKKNKILSYFAMILIGAVIFVPFAKSFFITKEIKNDTRNIATKWINENLEKDAKIYLDDKYYSPRPREGKFEVKDLKPLTDFPFEKYKKKEVDYVIVNSFRFDRYYKSAKSSETAREGRKYYERIFKEFELVAEFKPLYSFETYGFHNPIIYIYKVR